MVKQSHRYTLLYEMLFYPLKHKPLEILEMGLQIGGPEQNVSADRKTTALPSTNMWLNYFVEAHITGLDISDFSWFSHPRFSFVRCDMDDRENIAAASKQFPRNFDIIIDDASHASHHQQYGFLETFKYLKPGGLYIIEDLGWQPPAYERLDAQTTAELFWSFIESGQFSHKDKKMEAEFRNLEDEISFAHIFHRQYTRGKKPGIMVIHKEWSKKVKSKGVWDGMPDDVSPVWSKPLT